MGLRDAKPGGMLSAADLRRLARDVSAVAPAFGASGGGLVTTPGGSAVNAIDDTWFPVEILTVEATSPVTYTFKEKWLGPADTLIDKDGGRRNSAATGAVILTGSAAVVGDILLARPGRGTGGLRWELLPLAPGGAAATPWCGDYQWLYQGSRDYTFNVSSAADTAGETSYVLRGTAVPVTDFTSVRKVIFAGITARLGIEGSPLNGGFRVAATARLVVVNAAFVPLAYLSNPLPVVSQTFPGLSGVDADFSVVSIAGNFDDAGTVSGFPSGLGTTYSASGQGSVCLNTSPTWYGWAYTGATWLTWQITARYQRGSTGFASTCSVLGMGAGLTYLAYTTPTVSACAPTFIAEGATGSPPGAPLPPGPTGRAAGGDSLAAARSPGSGAALAAIGAAGAQWSTLTDE